MSIKKTEILINFATLLLATGLKVPLNYVLPMEGDDCYSARHLRECPRLRVQLQGRVNVNLLGFLP